VKQRRHPLLVSAAAAAGGAVLTYGGSVALNWLRYGRPFIDGPVPNVLADRFLRTFEVRERHEIAVAAPSSITWDAAFHLDLQRSWLVRAIIRARELILRSSENKRSAGEFREEVLALGWGELAEVPGRELVMGAVTKPWEADVRFEAIPPDEFASFRTPGYAKIVWTLEVDPLSPSSSLFRTETRVATTDPQSRARFRRYWSLVSPGIVLIRREALRLVKTEAERRNRKELSCLNAKVNSPVSS